MVAVVEPTPVIELPIGTHAPCDRLVRFAAVMAVITVQIREAVAEIPKRQKKTDVMPVKDAEDNKCAHKQCELSRAPKRLARILALQLVEDCLGIFTEKAEERIFEWMLGFAVVAVFVNGDPIDGLTVFVRTVGISLVMLHVNAFVENLAKADCD